MNQAFVFSDTKNVYYVAFLKCLKIHVILSSLVEKYKDVADSSIQKVASKGKVVDGLLHNSMVAQ